jgi:hypothetical protein
LRTIDVISRETGEIQKHPLDLEDRPELPVCKIQLDPAPGATAVQVVVREDEKVVAAMEVPALADESITVEVRRALDGAVSVRADAKSFMILPDDDPPTPLLLKPATGVELDFAVLVDGTCLHTKGTELEYLLSASMTSEWAEVSRKLADFSAAIAKQYSNVRVTAMAFGDEPMPLVKNPHLQPVYLVHPQSAGDRKWWLTTGAEISTALSTQLRSLPHTPGGDYVDGLADGMRACGDLPWRQNARKLLLILGQSPGYSVLAPPDGLTNLLARKLCIEEEVEQLHQKGIEVMTVFHHPVELEERYAVSMPLVVEHSRKQYESLASVSKWSVSSPEFTAEALASVWLQPPACIARGPSPGILSSVRA